MDALIAPPPLFRTVLVRPDSELGRGGPLAAPGLGRDPHVVQRVRVQVLQRVLRARRVFDCLVLRELLKTETNRTTDLILTLS